MSSRKGRGLQTSLFITKLQQMVENTQIESTISWTSTGDSFHIKVITIFTEEVLPRYFKHRNFSSFIRQLNMYGFRKIRHTDGENVYAHQYFRRDAKALLKNITRKIREERQERMTLYQPAQRGEVTKKDLQELRTKQKNLEQMCRQFVMQNQKLMEENHSLVKKIEEGSREKERRLDDFLILLLAQNNQSLTHDAPLSITNTDSHIHNHNASPLEVIAHNLEGSHQLHRLRDAIKGYGKHSDNKNRNEGSEEIWEREKSESLPNIEEDNSFMSIHDFLNADQYDSAIHLEQSR